MQRPRKPSISDIKERKFSEEIRGLRHRPHNGIVNRIDSKMFSLDGNRVYHYKPEVLASEEYKRCLELFERRLPQEFNLTTPQSVIQLQMRMNDTMTIIFNKEMRYVEELKQIAVDTVRSLFDIPEHVKILPEIDSHLDIDNEQDDSPEPVLSLSSERFKFIMEEVRKREILNGIVHGCAIHIWKSVYYIVKDKIDGLDPMLMELYDRYTTSISWLLWQMSPDDMQNAIESGNAITQGFNKLDFKEMGEAECDIHCHAINFPVLLHEITKGAIDYLICRGIPDGLTIDELKLYYEKSDNYSNEIWHYLLSPTLWLKLIEILNLETQNLPLVIMKLTQLSYGELCEIFISIIDGRESGINKLIKYKIV